MVGLRVHAPFKANVFWAYDFVFDTTDEGCNIKCLTVTDEYTRECMAIDVMRSIRSKRVIEVLSMPVSVHGAPLFMRSDNEPEFVSHATLDWITQSGIATDLSDLGKPWQNGADESLAASYAMSSWRSSGSDHAARPPSSSNPGASALQRRVS